MGILLWLFVFFLFLLLFCLVLVPVSTLASVCSMKPIQYSKNPRHELSASEFFALTVPHSSLPVSFPPSSPPSWQPPQLPPCMAIQVHFNLSLRSNLHRKASETKLETWYKRNNKAITGNKDKCKGTNRWDAESAIKYPLHCRISLHPYRLGRPAFHASGEPVHT